MGSSQCEYTAEIGNWASLWILHLVPAIYPFQHHLFAIGVKLPSRSTLLGHELIHFEYSFWLVVPFVIMYTLGREIASSLRVSSLQRMKVA